MNKDILCPVCKNVIDAVNLINTYKEYKLYKCLNNNCCLEFWWPMKMPEKEYYENNKNLSYLLYHKGLNELGYHQKPFFEHFCKKRPTSNFKLMDIGCADGVFLKECINFGFIPFGIDFDKNSIKIIRDMLKINNVYLSSLNDFLTKQSWCKKQFDVVTFFEVLEHQDNPKRFINDVKKIIKDDGYIAGSVPDGELVDLVERNKELDLPPHHFIKWNKKSLTYFLKINGFNDITIKNIYEQIPIKYYVVIMEKIVFKNLFRKIKHKLLSGIYLQDLDNNSIHEQVLQLEIEKLEVLKKNNLTKKNQLFFLKTLKFFRNFFFYTLLAIPYFVFLPKKKIRENLYFQCKYSKSNNNNGQF